MSKQSRGHLVKGRNGNIKLVLTEDVLHLGQQGEVVEVRPGYARNYLVPRGLGTIPTEHNLRLLDRYKVRVLQAREARIADIKALADQISKFSGITIESRANAENQLYGSVGSAEIAAGLKAKGYPIEAEMVVLEGAIRETGLFGGKLNLGFSIETEVKVAVVSLADKR